MTKNTPEISKLGTKIAEDINTAIDNNGYWDGNEMGIHLQSMQPDRKTQFLWDAAPDLLAALKEAIGLLAQDESGFRMDEAQVKETLRLARAAIAKAEGK